jgi:hypothetical protein
MGATDARKWSAVERTLRLTAIVSVTAPPTLTMINPTRRPVGDQMWVKTIATVARVVSAVLAATASVHRA